MSISDDYKEAFLMIKNVGKIMDCFKKNSRRNNKMINDENLNKLYNNILSKSELTTKELNEMGFTSKDIKDLIELGKLERIKRGYYIFLSIDDLYIYGKKLIAEKKIEEATKCFQKCFELDSKHSGASFQLFLRSLIAKDYEKVFEYFEVFFQTDNKFYSNDNNFYLYLLSIITELPEKHREYTRFLKIEDIRVDFEDKRYKDIPLQNKIRIAVLQRKFPYALKQLKDLITKHGFVTLQDIVTRTLLFQAIEVETKNKNELLEFVYNRDYEKAVEFLNSKEKRYNLSLNDRYVLKLLNVLLTMLKTGKVLERKVFQAEKLFDAIDGNNFELALKISDEYNQSNNINNNDNAINLLLGDICEEIKRLESKKEIVDGTKKEEFVEQEEAQILVDTTKFEEKKETTATFSDVIKYLLQKDLDNAFKTLRNYLNSIQKREYEFLIIDLIKISLIENDIAFTKAMLTLTYIIRDNFKFDNSIYIQEFYIALSQNKFDIARLYLDILINSKNLGIDCNFAEDLIQVLNAAEGIIEEIKSERTEEKKVVVAEEKNETIEFMKKPKQQKELNKKVEIKDSEREFIESKHNLLLNGEGIVLLRPMDSERRKAIHQIVKSYPDMVSFSIGSDNNRQIVLRYKPYNSEFVDVKNLILTGNIAYKNKRYEECISCYLQLLQFGVPKAVVYARLGLSYMKLWQKDRAINYLTIATELSKNENKQYDFTELIASLKGLIDESDKKPKFRMNSNEFINDTTIYYGIEDFDDITAYILESGLDVESACQLFEKTEEETDIIKLLYARWFYQDGNYQKGDEFLKSVEKSQHKTSKTKQIFDTIRTNKKFYINRERENDMKLSLKLQLK